MPIVSIDYMFLGCNKDVESGAPILVVKDRDPPGTGLMFAYVLEAKGCNSYAVDRLDKTLEGLGHNRIILKSDQEPAIIALKTAVKGRKTVEIVPEESPAYASSSNGAIESTNKHIQDQIRALKDALESRIGVRLEKDKNIISWLVMHAAEAINRHHIPRARGYTAFERWKGRTFRREIAEFGEKVMMYRIPHLKGKEKFEVRWSDGTYLGIRDESGEVRIGTKEGIIKVRVIRRKSGGRTMGSSRHPGLEGSSLGHEACRGSAYRSECRHGHGHTQPSDVSLTE